MNTAFLFRRRTRQATTIVLLLFAVATMFAAHYPALRWWATQAPWIALLYLMMGMGLLIFNRTRLMFVCLGCSAAISIFFSETNAAGNPGNPLENPPALEQNDSSSHEHSPQN